MLIGELAERAHINPQTVRFYERRGLVAEPPRTPSGYRDYTSAAVARIQFIRSAQTAGLTLKDIRGILQIRDSGSAPCDHVTIVLDTKLTEVRQRLRELADLENELMAILQSRQRLDTRHCSPDAICTLLAPITPTLPTQASTRRTTEASSPDTRHSSSPFARDYVRSVKESASP